MKMNEAQPHHTDTCVCLCKSKHRGIRNLIGWMLHRNERTYRDIIIPSRYINNLPPPPTSEEEKASKKFFLKAKVWIVVSLLEEKPTSFFSSSRWGNKKIRWKRLMRVSGGIHTHIRYPVWTMRPNVCDGFSF